MTRRRRLPLLLCALSAPVLASTSGRVQSQVLPELPHLLGFDTSGSETPGFAPPLHPLIAPVTQVRLRFDLALSTQPGSGVESPAHFRIVAAGPDRLLATTACAAQAAGDDGFVTILDVAWNALDNEVALRLDAPAGLPRGNYRVVVCDSLLAAGGLAFDGDGDGLPGGIALRDFAVGERGHLPNPGFDDTAADWQARSVGLGQVTLARVATDADGAASSGALRVLATAPASGALLGTPACVVMQDASTSPTPAWRTRLRYRVLQGNVRVFVRAWFGFSGDAPGETGCNGPGIDDEATFDAGVSPQFATFDTGWRRAVSYMPLATVTLLVVPRDGQPYELLLDDAGFAIDSQLIFRDAFHGY